MLYKIKIKQSPFLTISIIGLIYLGFVWFISDIFKAGLIDKFLLYYVDDVFRYCHIKAIPFNPIIALNYYLKIGYALIATFFYNIIPVGMSSLRIMNVLFSCGILFLIYKLTQRLSLSKFSANIAIILAATFPVFFLSSLSTLSEVIYSFFVILAIYLLYLKKHGLSIFLVAFLPLFRQEGLIYLFIWIYFLYKQVRIRYLFLLFLPTTIWMILNKQLLGLSFIKLIVFLPSKLPPNSMASFKEFLNLIYIISYHPIIILSAVGLVVTKIDKKYRFLKVCFITNLFFLIIFQSAHLFASRGLFCREIRFIMPLVPMMALYGGNTIAWLSCKYRLQNKLFMSGFISILIIIMAFQISQLQHAPKVVNDSMTNEQENLLKDTSIWLNDYLRETNIKKVCIIPGEMTTDKIIRRLWMYLPGCVEFYATGGEKKISAYVDNHVFDLVTLRGINLAGGTKCILISKENLDKNIFANFVNIDLIKVDTKIPLYFYLVSYN